MCESSGYKEDMGKLRKYNTKRHRKNYIQKVKSKKKNGGTNITTEKQRYEVN